MSSCGLSAARRVLSGMLALLIVSIVTIVPAAADPTGVAVTRVEEDWELVISSPDTGNNGPQVSCVMSPNADLDGLHSVLDMNHQSLPEFASGGIQLQVWDGSYALAHRKFPNSSVCATAGETITWTQTMTIAPGSIVFEIINGSSTTWGSFGGQGYLRSSTATSLEDLNGYHPEVSVENSGVSFASNRVQSLVLKRVRLVTTDGTVYEDATERVVHQKDD